MYIFGAFISRVLITISRCILEYVADKDLNFEVLKKIIIILVYHQSKPKYSLTFVRLLALNFEKS